MKRLLILLALVLVACGPPPAETGYVREKRFEPAHNDARTRQVYAGETCSSYSTGSGKNRTTQRSCTPQYRSETYYVWVPDAWSIFIQDCYTNPEECRDAWKRVDETTYHRYNVGDHYPNPR